MTTYVITAPDGRDYEVTGDGTEAEALAHFQSTWQQPQGKSVLGRSREMQSFRPSWANQDEAPGTMESLLGGAKHGFDRAAQGLAGLAGGQAVSPEQLAAGKAFVDETGVSSSLGKFGTDLAIGVGTGIPVLKGANMLRRTMQARNLGGAGAATVGADMLGNAGAQAALTPEDRGTAALAGAGSVGAGRALARTLGGPLAPVVSPEARTLLDNNVQLTPGQLVSGPNKGLFGGMVRSVEDSMQSFPIVGDLIKHARGSSVKSWNSSEINQALTPLKEKVSSSGRQGIEEAEAIISGTYDAVLPHTYVPQTWAQNVIGSIMGNAQQAHVLFDKQHERILRLWVDRRLKPVVKLGDIPGDVAKDLDAELGQFARAYSNGVSERDKPLGAAFAMLRDDMRTALQGTTPDAVAQLQAANKAYRNMVPLKAASETTNSGLFTPSKLRQASNKLKIAPTDSALAARDVLPDTVPDSGTAGRLAIQHLITPRAAAATAGAATTVGGLGAPAALAAALAAMYTKTGAKYLSSGGLDIINATLRALRKQPMTPENTSNLEELTRLVGTQGTKAFWNQGE